MRATAAFGGPKYPRAPKDFQDYANRGEHHKGASEYMHVVNATGMCQFIMMAAPTDRFPEWINKVTGWEITGDELQQAGERIANLRMAFEVREGNNPRARYVPGRLTGNEGTAQTVGPAEGRPGRRGVDGGGLPSAPVTGTATTARRGRAKLESLGLADVADALKV